jgi:hypothetical protein
VHKIATVLILSLCITTNIYSQNSNEQNYRRSSLTMLRLIIPQQGNSTEIIDDSFTESKSVLAEEMKKQSKQTQGMLDFIEKQEQDMADASEDNIKLGKSLVSKCWNSYPFPDKYDKHLIDTSSFEIILPLSQKEVKKLEQSKGDQADRVDDVAQTIKAWKISDYAIWKVKQYPDMNLSGGKFGQLASCIFVEDKRYKAIKTLAQKNMTISKYDKKLKKIDADYLAQKNKILKSDTKEFGDLMDAITNKTKNAKTLQPLIEQKLKDLHIGNQIVKKWFSSENGKMFDMSTIQQRGYYNATELEADIAKKNVRGMSTLGDAGEELISNTFITITDMQFFSNRPVANMLRQISNAVSNATSSIPLAGLFGSIASVAMDISAAAIEDGYSVLSRTFLYKLKWNDEIAANFYNIWGNEEAFNNMDFDLEFVDVQYDRSVINAGLFSKKADRQPQTVIEKVFVRNMDEVFATLQKENDIFKTKTPILSTNPLTAQIGMKEGLKGGEKFEILEKEQDPKTGYTKWKRVGITTVDSKLVWDNRYNAGEEPEVKIVGKDGQPIQATTFKSNAKAVPGMMLKLIK